MTPNVTGMRSPKSVQKVSRIIEMAVAVDYAHWDHSDLQ